jgi:hypothetical protein
MKRTFVYRDGEMVEVTEAAVEWLHTGTRFGAEKLAEMKRKGLVPPSDFTETWARKAAEREAIRLHGGTPEMKRERLQDIQESTQRVRAGYKPNRRDGF